MVDEGHASSLFEERAAKRRFSTFLQPLCKTLYFAAVLRLAEGKAVHL